MESLLLLGELVVSMTTYRDFLMIAGDQGTLIRANYDMNTGLFTFHVEARL